MTIQQAYKALSLLGLRPYATNSYKALTDAQQNLDGRSHYVSCGNLHCFRSKVLSCLAHENGMLLSIIESYVDRATGKPGRRAVIFNILGDIIHKGQHFSTTDRAELDRNAAILAHNTLFELETALINRATSLRETANEVMTAISGEVAL